MTCKPVFLCGFMGCGKSTSGRILSEILNSPFYDTDEYIVSETGLSIPAIFSQKGEAFFREKETEALRFLSSENGVISCGGGMMLKEENALIANNAGVLVFLDEDFEVCYSRIKDDPNRPIAAENSKENLKGIYDERIPVYSRNSRIRIKCAQTPEKTAELIKSAIE